VNVFYTNMAGTRKAGGGGGDGSYTKASDVIESPAVSTGALRTR
jgi:hypothetical protein